MHWGTQIKIIGGVVFTLGQVSSIHLCRAPCGSTCGSILFPCTNSLPLLIPNSFPHPITLLKTSLSSSCSKKLQVLQVEHQAHHYDPVSYADGLDPFVYGFLKCAWVQHDWMFAVEPMSYMHKTKIIGYTKTFWFGLACILWKKGTSMSKWASMEQWLVCLATNS